MQFPKPYGQEQTDYRTNESERKAYYWLRDFFVKIMKVTVSGVSSWLFGKITPAGVDKWQFDESLQVSDEASTPRIDLLLVRGTYEAPTAIQSGDNIGALSAVGYGTSNYYTGGSMVFTATENWTNAARGTKIVFKTTPTGTTTYEDSGYISAGGSWASGKESLATNATKGFLYIPYVDGTPSGTPETITTRYPIVLGKNADSVKVPYFWNADTSSWQPVVTIYQGTVGTQASTTSAASLRLPHGTAPASPVDGDVWTTSAGLFVRINGSTVGPLS